MIELTEARGGGRTATNLIGRAFGRLIVIAREGSTRAPRRPLWRCRCSCGRELVVLGGSLRAGRTRSCGCLRAEVARGMVAMMRAERTAGRAQVAPKDQMARKPLTDVPSAPPSAVIALVDAGEFGANGAPRLVAPASDPTRSPGSP